MSNQTEVQQSPEEQKNKVEKAFNETVTRLEAILGKAPSKTGRVKVPADRLGSLISELFKEENEAKEVEVKEEMKTLLKEYVKMNDEIRKKEQELAKVREDKMKEFTEAGKKLFNKIDGLPALEAKYKEALGKLNSPQNPSTEQ